MLRAATRAAHDRVDALFSGLDLSSDAGYRTFLKAQAAAFLPAEAALDAAGAETLFPDWSTRRRTNLLRADLAELGMTAPLHPQPIHFDTPSAVAGGAYVLEGSRLGGAVLSRSLPDGAPHRFLAPAGQTPGWKSFLARLDELLGDEADRRAAVTAASQTFDYFAQSARMAMGAS